MKTKIHAHVEQQWKEEIVSKASLKYLNPDCIKVGKVHPVFATVRNNTYDTRRAEVKVRLLTGTYTLQYNRAKFNQFNVSPICELCCKHPETREHFLILCESFRDVKHASMNKIRVLFDYSSGIIDILNNTELNTQLLLDATHPDIERLLQPILRQSHLLEIHSRELIYNLHVNRTKLLLTDNQRAYRVAELM